MRLDSLFIKYVMLAIIAFTFSLGQALSLEHFDRAEIIKHKISELSISVSRYKFGEEPDDWGGPCPKYIYKFDQHGNIIETGLARVGTKFGYQYDDSKSMVSWSWENKSSGEVTYFTKDNYDEKEFREEINEREKRFNKMLASKVDFRRPLNVEISDICSTIDAEYRLKLLDSEDDLPLSFKASKTKEIGSFPKKINSPSVLYISYDYIKFD
ncbi:hypothetical protein [Pleionea sediminis]|uniref:hypothetical protein n=1 Tax=Pleionea sediminis TaxID=2569479 RepID=UPI001186B1BD|nr:hypothetical protein [Pleionea sediminis]